MSPTDIIVNVRALIGDRLDDNESNLFAKAEYNSALAAHGPLVKETFYDIVLELLDIWCDNSGQFFRSAFAWALFDRFILFTVVIMLLMTLSHANANELSYSALLTIIHTHLASEVVVM